MMNEFLKHDSLCMTAAKLDKMFLTYLHVTFEEGFMLPHFLLLRKKI